MASFAIRAAHKAAVWLTEGELHLSGAMLRAPSQLARAKLRVARWLLARVTSKAPRHWNSFWIAGKIHERLGEYPSALVCFKQGLLAKPAQPDLAVEASLAAVYLGFGKEAEQYAQIAVAARPTDPGHRADLALALLIAGKAREAQSEVERAVALAPGDGVTLRLQRLISVIVAKALPCPKDMAGLQRLAKSEGITSVLQRTPG